MYGSYLKATADRVSLQEIISLASQLAYTYSANRRAACPFSSLLFTSINGRLRTKLEAQNDACYKRWENTEWREEGYEVLWTSEADEENKDSEDRATARKAPSRCKKNQVIYLTADADDEIEELKEGETYIIGGIVDHNRYKVCCPFLPPSLAHSMR